MSRLLGLIGVLLLCLGATEKPVVVTDPEVRCATLLKQDFAKDADAPLHLTSAKMIGEAETTPAFCQVQGYVTPNTGFELRLPTARWNGKFFYAGCTGSCGFAADSPWTAECDYPLARGYACIISDMGHRSSAADGLWAYQNLAARVDFGFRATHRTTVAGKAITTAFYRAGPSRSYFMGCSTGGRQALIEAQRFPDDFDGIIAGAPVISEGGTSMSFLWNLVALNAQGPSPLFTDADLALLHRAALAAADAEDGIKDGLISDPRAARFDPATLLCKRGQRGDCLSSAQVEAATKVYDGPRDSKGRALYPGGGFQPGSERGWAGYVTPPGGRARAARSGTDTTRHIMTDWGPNWDFTDFDFDTDARRLAELDVIYSASNPDLRAFAERGGKLLIYHGWTDTSVAPLNSVDYFETLQKTMGGAEATHAFARLFMVPGMNHCFGGDGAFAIDYIKAMEAWSEEGRAPDELQAAHLEGNHDSPSVIRRFPPTAVVRFTRPIYPYPLQARYRGAGDPNNAASFQPVDPRAR